LHRHEDAPARFRAVLIAQLTDLHVGPEDDAVCAGNLDRFSECLAMIGALQRRPDLLLVTGDVAEHGDRKSYRRFLAAVDGCGMRWTCTLGNHDDPDSFAAALAERPCAWLQQGNAFACGDWRVVLAESRCAGLDGGWFDEARAERLDATLRRHPRAPTLLALHHPPVAVGLDWMDPEPGAGWVERLSAVVERHKQVRQIVCGHVHLPIMTRFCGVPLAIAPATAAQLWPDLAPFIPGRPDGRAMVVEGVPGFALHRLGSDAVTTIVCSARPGATRLRHDRPRAEGAGS
jgi:3',5'-cyclic-AMP phosphodiesterase